MSSIAGGICLYFATTTAAMGGIGGGGINVPVLFVIWGYSYSTSLVLSLCAVFGNLMSQFMLNWGAVHPKIENRPLIYWDVVMVLAPALLMGSRVGVVLSVVLPTTVLMALAIVMLTFAATMTGRKALKYYGMEQANMAQAIAEVNDTLVDEKLSRSSFSLSGNRSRANTQETMSNLLKGKEDHSLSYLTDEPPVKFPWKVIGYLVMLWLIFTCFLAGSHFTDRCSTAYWIVGFIFYLPFFFAINWSLGYAARRQEKDPDMQQEGDVAFADLGIAAPIMAFGIGMLCALLGIGGGELAGPLLVSMGLLPQVVAATSSMFSLYGSSATVIATALSTHLNIGTCLMVFGIGICGGLSGRLLAIKVVSQLGRPSLTVFALVFCLLLSICGMVYAISTDESDLEIEDYC